MKSDGGGKNPERCILSGIRSPHFWLRTQSIGNHCSKSPGNDSGNTGIPLHTEFFTLCFNDIQLLLCNKDFYILYLVPSIVRQLRCPAAMGKRFFRSLNVRDLFIIKNVRNS